MVILLCCIILFYFSELKNMFLSFFLNYKSSTCLFESILWFFKFQSHNPCWKRKSKHICIRSTWNKNYRSPFISWPSQKPSLRSVWCVTVESIFILSENSILCEVRGMYTYICLYVCVYLYMHNVRHSCLSQLCLYLSAFVYICHFHFQPSII